MTRRADTLTASSAAVALPAAVAAVAGWVAVHAGLKGMVVGVAAAISLGALVVVRDRKLLITAGLVLSMAALLHKSIGPVAPDVNGGAPSVYVTTLDVVLVILYGLWLYEGTLVDDLARAFRRPILWAPVAGAGLTTISLLVARNTELGVAEAVRMGWMYALFVYLAVRVRNRREVKVLLAALGGLAVFEATVVLLQWRTGSALGLSFLGVPAQLGERVIDQGSLTRPFGTILHPVFMGAVMAPIGLLSLSLAIHLPRGRARWLALALVPACAAPLVVSNTRAALAGFAVAAVVLVAWCLAARRISIRTVATWTAAGLLVAVPFTPQLLDVYRNSLQSDHFAVELDARWELNELAVDMFLDKPLTGVGLNNFQRSMEHYDRYGLIFFGADGRSGHPVHNIFLLQLAESGMVGLAGLALIGIPLLVVAIRLARSRDPLLGGVGVGVAAVYLFFLVEENFVFSLRQDHPLALYWILAGLSVACLHMSGWRPTAPTARVSVAGGARPPRSPVPVTGRKAARPRRRWRPPSPVVAAVLLALVAAGFTAAEGSPPPPDTSELRIVFGAVERPGSRQALYEVNGDGTGLRRLSPDDGLDYLWPTWAMGGTKVVFTTRDGPVGNPENVHIMDADGTHRLQLTFEPWRSGQPKVSPDGRSLVFSSFWPEFSKAGIYKLDLETLQVTNLSARADTPGAADADPRWSADGALIAFAASAGAEGIVPTQNYVMNPDGTGRRALTNDSYYNTDPALSPDGRQVAIASYRGEGNSSGEDPDDPFLTKLYDFRLVVKDLDSGGERELTRGTRCYERVPPLTPPCTPSEASAYVPVWTPAGDGIGFVSALAATTTCICVMSPDGSNGRAVFSSDRLAIRWFDWVKPGPPPATAVSRIGERTPHSRLVLGGTDADGKAMIAVSDPDRYGERLIPVPPGFESVANPRLTPDGKHVIFSARTTGDIGEGAPHPAPPKGAEVHVHFTLDLLSPFRELTGDRPPVASDQVYLMELAGREIVRLTDPWLEDYMDAMAEGEARGNDQADLSPDGRYVVFRNLSSATDESFILRLDLHTGEVFNLTNATAGAMPTHDRSPRFSPDGQHVAFSGRVGGGQQIFTVSASDGLGFRPLTDDEHVNAFPAWSPDGTEIVYVSYRGTGNLDQEDLEALKAGVLPLQDWYLVKVDVATGRQTVLTSALDSPVFSPTWSPDGRQVAFISVSPPGQPDVHVVAAAGGPALPVQVTLLTHEFTVDWR